jgi:uncharacterized repeat protein (TIGR01451 family)
MAGKINKFFQILSGVILGVVLSISVVTQTWAEESKVRYPGASGDYLYGTTPYPSADAYNREPRMVKESDNKPVVVSDDMLRASIGYPTGRRDTSVLWIEKIYPATVRIGQAYKYTVRVTNLGAIPINNVEISEQIPADFNVTSVSPDFTSNAGGQASWDLGTLQAGEVRDIVVEGNSGSRGELPCCTSGKYDASALCVTSTVVEPAITVEVSSPESVTVCDVIPVKYVVTNTGDVAVANIKVKSNLPESIQADGGNNTVVLNVGTLAKGESREVTATVYPKDTGSFEIAAEAMGEGDVTAYASPTTTEVIRPSLVVTATSHKETQFVGRNLGYDIQVSNIGNAVAQSSMLKASIPSNTRFNNASENGNAGGSQIRWDLGDLAPGASRSVSFNVVGTDAGTAATEVVVSGVCAEDATAAASTDITGIAAILLEVIDVEDPIEVGNEETYEIRVTNQGSAADTNIKIEAELENMEYIASSGPTSGANDGGSITFEPLGSLAAKDSVTWRVVAKGVEAGDLRFKVSLTSDQLGRPVEETESTHVY